MKASSKKWLKTLENGAGTVHETVEYSDAVEKLSNIPYAHKNKPPPNITPLKYKPILHTALLAVVHGIWVPWRHLVPKKISHGHSQNKSEKSLQ